MKRRWIASLAMVVAVSVTHAATWDGSEGDNLWTNEMNWVGGTLPAASETIEISNGDAVDATGLSGGNLPNSCIVNLSGNSTLTRPSGAIRMNNATLNVASGSGLTGNGYWDLNGATINFEDGAIATMNDWEQKGNNEFKFELGTSGFTTLTPGALRLGGGATMANATYIADLQNYTGGTGTVTLVDFSSNPAGVTTASFLDSSRVVTNAGAYTNSTITFDAVNFTIDLNILAAPPAVIPPVTWDNDSGDGNWTTAANWDPDGVPTASDNVLVGAGGTVTNAQNAFGILEIESGASVTFSQNLSAGNVITNAGTLDKDGNGVLRLQGSTVNMTGTGGIGTNMTFLDTLNGNLNFEDGASLSTNLAFEIKGNPTFGFTLSPTGFSTVEAAGLYNGIHGATTTWENVTFEINAADYDISNGKTIVLMDFTNRVWIGTDTAFDPSVSVEGGVGTLAYDEVEHQIILSLYDVVTWDNGGSGSDFSTDANWIGDVAPISGAQSVLFDTAVNGDTAYLKSAFTVASNQVMLSTYNGVVMRIGANAELTVETGGALDFTSGGNGEIAQDGDSPVVVTIEGGAKASIFRYYPQSNWTNKFVATSAGVTTFEVKQQLFLKGSLVVDVSNYDVANGTDLVLFDYGTLAGDGVFSNITVVGGSGTIDYAYDQGGGDLAIALTVDADPYVLWALDYGLDGLNGAGPDDINNDEGINNISCYGWGLNPTNGVVDDGALPALGSDAAGLVYIVAQRNDDPSLNFSVLTRDNLVVGDWNTNNTPTDYTVNGTNTVGSFDYVTNLINTANAAKFIEPLVTQ